jgi:hypothetical protein
MLDLIMKQERVGLDLPRYYVSETGELVPLSVALVLAVIGEKELAVKKIEPTPSDPIFVSSSGHKVGYIPVK